MNRFDNCQYDKQAADLSAAFKEAFTALDRMIGARLANGRAKALAVTNMEQAFMWVGKALRDEQIVRVGVVEDE